MVLLQRFISGRTFSLLLLLIKQWVNETVTENIQVILPPRDCRADPKAFGVVKTVTGLNEFHAAPIARTGKRRQVTQQPEDNSASQIKQARWVSFRESSEIPPYHHCHSYQQLDNVYGILPVNLSKLSWFILYEQKKRLKSFMKAVSQSDQVSNGC